MKKKGVWKKLAFSKLKLAILDDWDMTNDFMSNWVTP